MPSHREGHTEDFSLSVILGVLGRVHLKAWIHLVAQIDGRRTGAGVARTYKCTKRAIIRREMNTSTSHTLGEFC